MCLYNPEKIETEEDIICYKKFRVIKGKLYSPYYNDTEWKIGETKEIDAEDADIEDIEEINYVDMVRDRKLDGNAFHSYTPDSYGQYYKQRDLHLTLWVNEVICKCIIPKDSKYIYKGDYVGKMDSYASQKLKVEEVVRGDKRIVKFIKQ